MENNSSCTIEQLNYLSGQVIDATLAVHREMGPGLLESVYQACLVKELRRRNIGVELQVPITLVYKGELLNKEFVLDLLVEDEIVVELKSVETILPVHEAQTISYMKLASKRLGLLINFNVPYVKQGIRRFVHKL